MNRVAIIGGTGLETLPPEWDVQKRLAETPFGAAKLWDARCGEQHILFVSRHGDSHGLLPHQVNYRANIQALSQLGIRQVFATNAVGSLRLDLEPGSLVLLDDFIDFTKNRPVSLWDDQSKIRNSKSEILHTDFSEPYCPILRAALVEASAEMDVPLLQRATYVCTEGPRFESPAEVRMFAQWGGDVVGMTGLPEAVFAREAGICYAAIGIVTNYAAGLTPEMVDHVAVVAQMERQVEEVRRLLLAAARIAPGEACRTCGADVIASGPS